MAKPFTTKRAGGNIYVQFALPDGGRTFQKSTGTSNRKEAEKIAMERLVNGNIPEQINSAKPSESRVRLYWLPALKGKYIGEITKDDLKSVLADKRIQTLAPKTINGIIDSITIPLKWAFNEGYTENICYEGLRRKTTKSHERHILTMDEAENLFHGDYWDNVAMHTGMRAGEIAALRVKDIQPDGIHVGSSWCKYMELKSCKNGEERDIPIPISDELREELMIQAQMNPYFDGDESFIFFGMDPTKPACSKQWNKYLKRALTLMKYPNPKEICFHLWRHFFCSRMLDVIPDKRVVMALSGHKTTAMLDHYGKHLEQEKTLAIAKEAIKEVFKNESTNEPVEIKNFKMVANM